MGLSGNVELVVCTVSNVIRHGKVAATVGVSLEAGELSTRSMVDRVGEVFSREVGAV